MKAQIEAALKLIINMQLLNIGRAADLEWFGFSSAHPLEMDRGAETLSSEYTLHVECAWRITGPNGIIVGSRDRYYRAGNNPFQDLEDFDWDVPGSNRCDEVVANFISSRSEKMLTVLSIEADYVGGLHIRFSENYTLDLFPDDSLGGEYWRFFKLGSRDSHFVVTGRGVIESND